MSHAKVDSSFQFALCYTKDPDKMDTYIYIFYIYILSICLYLIYIYYKTY